MHPVEQPSHLPKAFWKIWTEKSWLLNEMQKESELEIKAFREGEVPGIHTVVYESEADSIRITHDAKSRKGSRSPEPFLAAEFTKGKSVFGNERYVEITIIIEIT